MYLDKQKRSIPVNFIARPPTLTKIQETKVVVDGRETIEGHTPSYCCTGVVLRDRWGRAVEMKGPRLVVGRMVIRKFGIPNATEERPGPTGEGLVAWEKRRPAGWCRGWKDDERIKDEGNMEILTAPRSICNPRLFPSPAPTTANFRGSDRPVHRTPITIASLSQGGRCTLGAYMCGAARWNEILDDEQRVMLVGEVRARDTGGLGADDDRLVNQSCTSHQYVAFYREIVLWNETKMGNEIQREGKLEPFYG
ncbi:hypothetical protein BJ912DRAFT_932470 [Pholiota molesta]|nr:hypothetical protein BJ912DRAFT_932470 [Pholiota molesta]